MLPPAVSVNRTWKLARCGFVNHPAAGKNHLDAGQFLVGEGKAARGSDAILHLAHAAGADDGAGDRAVAQHPGQRHLRQRLPAGLRHSLSFLVLARTWPVTSSGRRKRPSRMNPRVLRNALEITIRQQSLCEGRKDDAPDPLLLQRGQQLRLDPAVEHAVTRLVDETGAPISRRSRAARTVSAGG